jgi:hypothetical protein
MDMVELKRVEKEKKEMATTAISDYPQDEYPVSFYLENDQLDQLGIKNLDVGDEMMVMAKVKVRSFSASETTQGSYKSASLTVMAMKMAPATPQKSAAQTLYGDKDGE